MRALVQPLAACLLAWSMHEAAVRTASTAAARKPATVEIAIDGMTFSPSDATVTPGDTIIWTNKDVVAHTVTSQTGAFDSNLIPPGGTWKYVAKARGSFGYTCSYHLPMTATFTVR
jgi:plastocyanin